MDDDAIIDIILGFEGGYCDYPADRGGPTRYGITTAQLGRWLQLTAPASVEQVQALPLETARSIYKAWYIRKPGFQAVEPDRLRLVLVDSGVLHGPVRAIRWLQQSLAVPVDGIIGPVTREALKRTAGGSVTVRDVLRLRLRAVAELVAADPSQIVFLRGWIARATSLLDYV